MSCTRPISAQRYYDPEQAKLVIRLAGDDFKPNLELNCGNCTNCKLRKAKEWALRCWHESQMHDNSCYVTFTYSDENLPAREELDHRHFQLFMKRLRRRYMRQRFSYFMCGEYGDKTHRPHYHAVIFGYWPPDAEYHRTEKGHKYFKSAELDYLWGRGFTDTSYVSYKNAGYVARYTLKKQLPSEELQDRYTWVDENGELHVRKFEYTRMSTDPAIGQGWFYKYMDQTLRDDFVRDPDGHECPVPKHYLDVLKREDPDLYVEMAVARLEKAKANAKSPDQLRQHEICTEARSKQLKRPYL